MFHDIQNQLMVKQAITTGATLSTDVYDLVATNGMDPSIGRMYAALFVPTVAAAGTVVATSYTLEVLQSTVSAMTSPDVIATGSYAGTSFTLDAMFQVVIPQGSISKEFIAFRVTAVGGTAPTVTLSAYLVPVDEIPVNKFFKKVYTTI